MREGLIRCYIMSTKYLEEKETFFRAYNNFPNNGLWGERKERIREFRFHQDKLRSLSAGMLLIEVLNRNNIDYRKLKKTEYGKLYIEDNPIYFNLSHSGEYVICSVGFYKNGADVEEIKIQDIEISKNFFHNDEYIRVKNSSSNMFTRLWTLKESYVKFLGLGLSVPLNSFAIYPGNELEVEKKEQYKALELEDNTYLKSNCNLKFKEFIVGNYHISICSEHEISSELEEIELNI